MDYESENMLRGKLGGPGFSVPENYFDQLNQDIQTRISVEKLKDLSNHNGFEVPELYFQQLNVKINKRIMEDQGVKESKVIHLWHSDLFKYATAACFILIAAFGLYFNNNHAVTAAAVPNFTNEQILFDIDEQVIIDQVQENQVLQTHTIASEQEMEAYILSNYSQNDIATNL